MNNRGWGWTPSEIRRVQLLEWIAGQAVGHPEQYVEVEDFYDARPDQGENAMQVAFADLGYLTDQRLAVNGSGIGGIESIAVMLTPQGHDFVEKLLTDRQHKVQRKVACRDAMVAWLYTKDATNTACMPIRDDMLNDSTHGMWLAAPFSLDDLADAAYWLKEQGFVGGIGAAQATGPLRPYLKAPGVSCAEDYESDTRRYLEDRMGRRSGPAVTIENNSGPLQVAGDYAHQVQEVGASAEQLRGLISSIAELVRLAAPDADDLDSQRAAALAAAKDGAVDQSVIKRFATWALATVQKGAAAALTPAVTAATTDMLREAGRLSGHL